MHYLQQSFQVHFEYKVFFTSHLFSPENRLLRNFLQQQVNKNTRKKILFVADNQVIQYHPDLPAQIKAYFDKDPHINLVNELLILPGGEAVKNDPSSFSQVMEAVNRFGIDRHSWIAAIGGGAVLDLVGYAAAVAHRGIRHIRIPTTVLSQNDSGVGVKNGINYSGKKNFIGSFSPPAAVFNDSHFLTTLSDEDYRSGISEAIKVALIKDPSFFRWISEHAFELTDRNGQAMEYLVKRCAELHLEHIASGDPFETGSSRPLDFGHWSAHKLEQLSNFSIRHGEAVAMGIALDSTYSFLTGRLQQDELRQILSLITQLGFALTHPLLELKGQDSPLLQGLEEFREHLGGQLTIMLLNGIGKGEEVHELDAGLIRQSAEYIKKQTLTQQLFQP
jgi:3-dehydroquinate synthase